MAHPHSAVYILLLMFLVALTLTLAFTNRTVPAGADPGGAPIWARRYRHVMPVLWAADIAIVALLAVDLTTALSLTATLVNLKPVTTLVGGVAVTLALRSATDPGLLTPVRLGTRALQGAIIGLHLFVSCI